MPKVTLPTLPLSAVFAVAKPSGPTSMSIVETIKPLLHSSRLFATDAELAASSSGTKKKNNHRRGKGGHTIKIGTGGTLDPLADGVLVLGVNEGTKKLGGFLECTKAYRTTCLLGASTDSYDAEGSITRTAPFSHLTPATISSALASFRGAIDQTPPLFSALKMDGMPLYEYARKGIPLPRKIEKRKATVTSLVLERWIDAGDHSFAQPEKRLSAEEREKAKQALRGAATDTDAEQEAEPEGTLPIEEEDAHLTKSAPAFVLRMEVSGGTYVRSIVHDVCAAVGTAGHVATLTRVRQGDYVLDEGEKAAAVDSVTEGVAIASTSEVADDSVAVAAPAARDDYPAVPWSLIQSAAEKLKEGKLEEEGRDADGWLAWERAVLDGVGFAETRRRPQA